MNNIPAFPRPASPAHEYGFHKPQEGMTLRDYFATRVMQAMLGSNWTLKDEEIPARAYKMADMMMKAREA